MISILIEVQKRAEADLDKKQKKTYAISVSFQFHSFVGRTAKNLNRFWRFFLYNNKKNKELTHLCDDGCLVSSQKDQRTGTRVRQARGSVDAAAEPEMRYKYVSTLLMMSYNSWPSFVVNRQGAALDPHTPSAKAPDACQCAGPFFN